MLDIDFGTGAAFHEMAVDVPQGQYNLFYEVKYLDTKPKARTVDPAVKYSVIVAKPQFVPGTCSSKYKEELYLARKY